MAGGSGMKARPALALVVMMSFFLSFMGCGSMNDRSTHLRAKTGTGADSGTPNTILIDAIKADDIAKVRHALDVLHADIDYSHGAEATPLVSGCYLGRREIVRELLKRGVNVNLRKRARSYTALSFALENGHREMALLLLENGADVNLKYDTAVRRTRMAGGVTMGSIEKGITLLMYAAANEDIELVQILLDHHADINAFDDSGATPLLWALFEGKVESAQLLIRRGAEVNLWETKMNISPLIAASAKGYEKIVALLLDKKADIRHRDANGMTALDWAKEGAHAEVVRLLLDYEKMNMK
jgi:ankyrin repeat protein